MQLSVERLRWGLLTGGVVLLLAVSALLASGRYKALQAWHRILQRTGGSLTRETNGFTYSQTVGGRTVFTLHAAKAVQSGRDDGKYALHDVIVTLFTHDGMPADRIYGSDFEYDEKSGVARALGEVQMDLHAPGALAGKPSVKSLDRAASVGTSDVIHVRTSGLVYVRQLGVAATDQDVEFRYGDLECHAHGAEFNSGQSTVHLLADVRVNGDPHGTPMHLTAARADLDRQTDTATLLRPEVHTADRFGRADSAILHLRQDGSPERAEATGSVGLRRGTETLAAHRMETELSATSVPQWVHFMGGVQLDDTDPARPVKAKAAEVRVSFDATGRPVTATGRGAAEVSLPGRLRGAARDARTLRGEQVVATFGTRGAKDKAFLALVEVTGGAHVEANSVRVVQPVPGRNATQAVSNDEQETEIAADDLRISFTPAAEGQSLPERVEGAGHTLLAQTESSGQLRRSTGDQLTLTLAPGAPRSTPPPAVASRGAGSGRTPNDRLGTLQVATALQAGHVLLHSVGPPAAGRPGGEVTDGGADRAMFTAVDNRLVLTGSARVESAQGRLTAGLIGLAVDSGDLEAHESVLATLTPAKGAGSTAETHVTAASAHFAHASGVSQFTGSDAHPTHLWQEGSQVEAATILIDGPVNTLTARPAAAGGLVRCFFAAAERGGDRRTREAGAPKSTTNPSASPADRVLRVTSPRLDYAGPRHEATFLGGVHLSGALGDAHAAGAVVFLNSPDRGTPSSPAAKTSSNTSSVSLMAGSVERIVLSGKVEIAQTERHGTGDQLVYTAASDAFVLTGSPAHPPRVIDGQGGSVTGTTLLFRTGDNTVVVASDGPRPGVPAGRVQSRMDVRPE